MHSCSFDREVLGVRDVLVLAWVVLQGGFAVR